MLNKPRMHLYFIRHGQTDFNKNGYIGGREDKPLNEIGVQQIEDIVQQLPENISVFYCSPLQRTRMSAYILNRQLGLSIHYDDDLKERDFGNLTGKSWDELETLDEFKHLGNRQHQKYHYDYRPYGGESIDDVHKRALHFLETIKAKYPKDARILIVTSGGIIRMMYLLMKNEQVDKIENASIHEFII